MEIIVNHVTSNAPHSCSVSQVPPRMHTRDKERGQSTAWGVLQMLTGGPLGLTQLFVIFFIPWLLVPREDTNPNATLIKDFFSPNSCGALCGT